MSRVGNTPSARTWALVLFAVALAIRAGFLWLHPEYTDGFMSIRGVPYSDARDWNGMAKSTATGHGVDSTYPGMRALYPIFLAHFYTWFGDSLPLAKALQALIGAASTALVFLTLRRAMVHWAALAAALFFAADPRQVTQAGKLMTEPFGLLLILLSAWCLMIGGERRRPGMMFASGAFFACANLARPLTLFALPLFVSLVALNARHWRTAAIHVAAFVLGTMICLGPWVVRERIVHGIWGISCNSAEALFAASSPEFGTWTTAVKAVPEKAGIPRKVKERYDFFQSRFRENLRIYPGFYAKNVARSLGGAALSGENFSAAFRCWTAAIAVIGIVFTLWWRLFPGAVLVVCHFGSLLGSALFGNPDLQRMRLLIDWLEVGWVFAGLAAVGSVVAAIWWRVPLREILDRIGAGNRDAIDAPAPGWLRGIGWGFGCFAIISAGRLVVLNCFTTPVPALKWELSDAERTGFLRKLAARDPAWQRMADPTLLEKKRGWKRTVFVEAGWIERDVYHFPAGTAFQNWSGHFEPRPYEHTNFTFHGPDPSFASSIWAAFAGEMPSAIRQSPCVLIGLTRLPSVAGPYAEKSVETVALIPAPDFEPDLDRILVTPLVPEIEALLDRVAPPPQ